MNWTATIERYIAEGRTVSGGKGDKTLKAQEQAQANFTNTLMASYKTQFAKQGAILDFLTSKMKPMIDNPTGYSPAALTAMRTQATEGTAKSYSQAEQALHEAEATRGGNGLPSGVDAQLEAENARAGAAQNATSQQDITLANENLRQANYWNAVNSLGGTGAQFNPTGYANSANSGTEATSNIGTAYKNSQSSQLLGALGGIAGGVGSAVGGYFTGKGKG
jgi:hypothetical protein